MWVASPVLKAAYLGLAKSRLRLKKATIWGATFKAVASAGRPIHCREAQQDQPENTSSA